jgi:hypothetical protein
VFSGEIERAIGQGFLKSADILVLDNAAIHFGGVNEQESQLSGPPFWPSYAKDYVKHETPDVSDLFANMTLKKSK